MSFLGTQPMLTQVPPSAEDSITATLAPRSVSVATSAGMPNGMSGRKGRGGGSLGAMSRGDARRPHAATAHTHPWLLSTRSAQSHAQVNAIWQALQLGALGRGETRGTEKGVAAKDRGRRWL